MKQENLNISEKANILSEIQKSVSTEISEVNQQCRPYLPIIAKLRLSFICHFVCSVKCYSEILFYFLF